MALTENQKRQLRKLAHHLKPVVITGQSGISEGVINEIDLALEHHELIKVRVNAVDRDDRRAMIEDICTQTDSELVQSIGHIATLFRRSREKPPRITLS